MNIFVDESGSFVWHPKEDSWSVVVAIATPESSRSQMADVVRRLRRSQGTLRGEVKLPELGEREYIQFLDDLKAVEFVMFATATDSGTNSPDRVESHQAAHVANIRANIPRMVYDGGRAGMALLADQLESLPYQLYVQLHCQVNLFHDVIGRAINFYVQRRPSTLNEFRWRIDQKNTTKTVFEEAFEKFAPPLLQARSIREPFKKIRGLDYRHFSNYDFQEGEFPDYLQREYGLPSMEGFNLQKLFRGNLRFVDSTESDGIQVADLLASGLRRVLKGAFDNRIAVAEKLGQLTIQNTQGRPVINLISFGAEKPVSKKTDEVVHRMCQVSKQFFVRRSSG